MPALPKFSHTLGLVGGIEVFGEGEAHPKCDSDGNIGVAAEVGIDLHRVGEQTEGVFPARIKCGLAKDSVGEVHRQKVSQNHFFEESVQDPEHTQAELASGH